MRIFEDTLAEWACGDSIGVSLRDSMDWDRVGEPVTIIPGHIAEMLRWRDPIEEEPTDGKEYLVENEGERHIMKFEAPKPPYCGQWDHRLVCFDCIDTKYRDIIPGIDTPSIESAT